MNPVTVDSVHHQPLRHRSLFLLICIILFFFCNCTSFALNVDFLHKPKQHIFVVKFIFLYTQTSTTSSNPTHAVSTWPPHSQDAVATAAAVDRPHTISTAYEKGHQRPALTVYTFQSPEISSEAQKSPANVLCRPPLPIVRFSLSISLIVRSIFKSHSPFYVLFFDFVVLLQRCSSLERPLSSTGARNANMQSSRQCPSPLPAHITKGVFFYLVLYVV